jgi:membrane fusion protein (multidrug efflux system)
MINYINIFLFILVLSIQVFAKEIVFVVESEVVKAQSFSFKRRFIGTLSTEYFSLLKPKMSGIIDEINVKAEQKISKNQHLFSLDNEAFKKSVELDKKNLSIAHKALMRAQSLFKHNDITKAQLDEAQSAKLRAEHRLLESQKALRNAEVLAPFDGIAGVPRVVMGQQVEPSDTLISIQKGAYFVTIQIPASRLNEISPGQKIIVNKEEAFIDAVERSVDPKTRTGFAKAIIKGCERCIVGGSVFVDVIIEDNPQAIMLSRNAIFYEKGQAYVVVVKNENNEHKADLRAVTLGKEQEGLVHIVSGLNSEDIIVKANPRRLRQGSLLKVLP